jgi:hypothetical chaperone protein
VVALAQASEAPEMVEFAGPEATSAVFRSALCFWEDAMACRSRRARGRSPNISNIPRAAASSSRSSRSRRAAAFEHASVFDKRLRFEELGRTFLRKLVEHAGGKLDALPERIVVGRPIEYAGSRPDPEAGARAL